MARKTARRKSRRGFSHKATNVERVVPNEPVEAREDSLLDSQVTIVVVSYRVGPADPDGVSGKAAIDALVHLGILVDDCSKWVKEIRHVQIQVEEEEETLILLVPSDKLDTLKELESLSTGTLSHAPVREYRRISKMGS